MSAGFRRSGLWPLDVGIIITATFLKDVNEADSVISPEELIQLYEEKHECGQKEIIGEDLIAI